MATRNSAGARGDNGGEHDLEFDYERNNDGFNRFFGPPDLEEGRPGGALASYEVPEPVEGEDDEHEPIYLECVDLDWFKRQEPQSVPGWFEALGGAPLLVLEIDRGLLPPANAAPGTVLYLVLQFRPIDSRNANARVFRTLFSEGTPVRVYEIAAQPGVLDQLRPASFIDEVRDHFSRCFWPHLEHELFRPLRGVKSCGGVAVYDVGQGSWQGVLTDDGQTPQMYVDVGGGVLVNRGTFPKTFGRPPSVPLTVLSHWDWDHWSSAHRFRNLLHSVWVAPPVPDTFIQLNFALDLDRHGMLFMWGRSWHTAFQQGCIRIEKCTGVTQNDGGLCVTAYSKPKGGRNCLLPGDAAYKYIPSVATNHEKFSALCMSHHGGRLHSVLYPEPKRLANAANSSGPRNTYKHPLIKTLSHQAKEGWPMPAQTGMSGSRPCHVLLPWGQKPKYFHGNLDFSGKVLTVG